MMARTSGGSGGSLCSAAGHRCRCTRSPINAQNLVHASSNELTKFSLDFDRLRQIATITTLCQATRAKTWRAPESAEPKCELISNC